MKIYLAGYMNKKVIEKCIAWRKQIRLHYENWKDKDKKENKELYNIIQKLKNLKE
jgi:hypothetical protein